MSQLSVGPHGVGVLVEVHAKIHAAFLLLLTNRYGDGDVAPDANPFYLHGRSERGAGTDAHVTATPEGTHAVHLAVHVAEPAVTPRRAFSWVAEVSRQQTVYAGQRRWSHIVGGGRRACCADQGRQRALRGA